MPLSLSLSLPRPLSLSLSLPLSLYVYLYIVTLAVIKYFVYLCFTKNICYSGTPFNGVVSRNKQLHAKISCFSIQLLP